MPKKQMAPTPVRLPDDLKAWVQASAEKNLRSMNAEIIAMLLMARALNKEGDAESGARQVNA